MKSTISYITASLVLVFFSACTPPAGADGKAASGGMGGTIQFIFLGMMILVFWMFFIRPQAKKPKPRSYLLRIWVRATRL